MSFMFLFTTMKLDREFSTLNVEVMRYQSEGQSVECKAVINQEIAEVTLALWSNPMAFQELWFSCCLFHVVSYVCKIWKAVPMVSLDLNLQDFLNHRVKNTAKILSKCAPYSAFEYDFYFYLHMNCIHWRSYMSRSVLKLILKILLLSNL